MTRSIGADVLASVYLAPEPASAWGWAKDRVLAWRTGDGQDDALDARGALIAFEAQVAQVLARLAPEGLPSFQSLVLVLAACREGWVEGADDAFQRLLDVLDRDDVPDRVLVAAEFARVAEAMIRITDLPASLRAGPDAQAALASVVLARAPRRFQGDEARALAESIEAGFEPASSPDAVGPGVVGALLADLRAIVAGVAALPDDALARRVELRLRTGFDVLVRPADIDLEEAALGAGRAPSDAERAARLLEELRGDAELGGLCRLARDLRAAVHVPRPIAQDEDLAIGGVSDISNRGPLDRLLVSELAHDDLTFVVRVAQGEALYLRREAPPRAPAGGRALLLDQGVRLWGVGRVFATAVALAATATAGRRAAVRAWRHQRGALVAVDLLSREGLVEHLGALDASAHPGDALAPWVEATAPTDDLIVVTSEAALHDPPFERGLAALIARGELGGRALWLATVDAQGAYRLRSIGARGRRLVAQATLDLAATLSPPAASIPAPPLREPGDARLPLILTQERLPLRLPHAPDPVWSRQHPRHGLVSVTKDGRLLHWPPEPQGLGARQVSDRIPRRSLLGLELDDAGRAWAVTAAIDPARPAGARPSPPPAGLAGRGLAVLRVDLDGSAPSRLLLHGGPPRAVVRHGGALLLVHDRSVDVVGLDAGTRLASVQLAPDVRWVRDRFFRDGRRWLALGWDGMGARLDPVGAVPKGALALWDRPGRDGPWWLLPDRTVGSVLGERIDLSPPKDAYPAQLLSVLGVSRDGSRVLARTELSSTVEMVDLERQRCSRSALGACDAEDVATWLESAELARLTQTGQQLRTRLNNVGLDRQGRLALVSRRERVHILDTRPAGGLVLSPRPGGSELRSLKKLEEHPGVPGVGWTLRAATWPDGSRALLDSRGLLHLQSARPGPEVTIALAEPGPLAVWTSDGGLLGPAAFTGVSGPLFTSEAQVLAHIVRFCEGIR